MNGIGHSVMTLGLGSAAFLAVLSTVSAEDVGVRPSGHVLTGKAALGDWTTDAPGVRRKITLDDLATPYDTPSANNVPRVVKRPEGAWPQGPRGLQGHRVRHRPDASRA